MPTPTYATVIGQINTFIVANGNNEITANVLNPILKLLADFSNNTIGDLGTLTTDENENLVVAINSLKENINNISSSGIKLFTGTDTPISTPPTEFDYGDFYMQLDFLTNDPIQLWQWDGFNWIVTSQSSTDNAYIIENHLSEVQEYELPTGGKTSMVFINNVHLMPTFWDQVGNTVTVLYDPTIGFTDEIVIYYTI